MPIAVTFPTNVAKLLATYDPEEHEIIIIIGKPLDGTMDLATDCSSEAIAQALLKQAGEHIAEYEPDSPERTH